MGRMLQNPDERKPVCLLPFRRLHLYPLPSRSRPDNVSAWSRSHAVRPIPSDWCGVPSSFWLWMLEPTTARLHARCTSTVGPCACGAIVGSPSPPKLAQAEAEGLSDKALT